MRLKPALPGENTWIFTRCSCYRLVQHPAPTSLDLRLACWVSAQHAVRVSGRRSDTAAPTSARSPRAPSPPVTKFHGAMPATGTCASNTAPLSQGTGACALSAALSATGAYASGAAPLSLGTGAYAPSAAPHNHAPRSSQAAALPRRSFQQGCSTPPPPGHAVAVGLRWGKAYTEAPKSGVKLNSAFPRNSGGSSTLFPVKEEPTRLANSSPFPTGPAGSKPSPVDNI